MPDAQTFSFACFEGPLDLLWHLVHQEELDIFQISLIGLLHQFLQLRAAAEQQPLDRAAEFIALAAALILYKSKALLPAQSPLLEEEPVKPEEETPFENIHYLVDYCTFKQAAKNLSRLEQTQEMYYSRGIETSLFHKKQLGIDHLSLDDLNKLFHQILLKSPPRRETLPEEEWKVSDKIKLFREIFAKQKSIPFITLFTSNQGREELIVAFLALLELMKTGELCVVKERAAGQILIQTRK